MKLSILTVNKIEKGELCVNDLTPSQQLQYKRLQIDKKIVEHQIHNQILNKLKNIGKFDISEIWSIIEKYATDEEDFWDIYYQLDFKWINTRLKQLELEELL